MQDRPDKDALLDALASFLGGEVLPAVTDPALSFRVRIAAHLLQGLAREVRAEEADDIEHLATLLDLVGSDAPPPTTAEARREAIRRAEGELCARIRAGDLTDDEERRMRAAMRRLVGARAKVGNPRFDTSDDPEGPR